MIKTTDNHSFALQYMQYIIFSFFFAIQISFIGLTWLSDLFSLATCSCIQRKKSFIKRPGKLKNLDYKNKKWYQWGSHFQSFKFLKTYVRFDWKKNFIELIATFTISPVSYLLEPKLMNTINSYALFGISCNILFSDVDAAFFFFFK